MWPDLIIGAAWPPLWGYLWACIWRLFPGGAPDFARMAVRCWLVTGASCTLIWLLADVLFDAAGGGIATLAALLIWWWRRKDRKPALKSAGAKSRARLAAIVKRAKDASRGARPVLRPVHGGAS